jgi:hypothetical protein
MATKEEPTTLDQTTLDLRKVPLVEPEDGMFEAYANVVNLNWTLHDVRIRFAELTQQVTSDSPGTWKDQEPVMVERVAVTLPWHQAKLLQSMLGDLVRSYEELNGELKQVKLPVVS